MSRYFADTHHISNLRKQIREIELLGESDFRRLEFDLVSHYRRNEADQELIAVELSSRSRASSDPVLRSRVGEIIAMLDHVHDPFISAS
jgi:hypothetical protein